MITLFDTSGSVATFTKEDAMPGAEMNFDLLQKQLLLQSFFLLTPSYNDSVFHVFVHKGRCCGYKFDLRETWLANSQRSRDPLRLGEPETFKVGPSPSSALSTSKSRLS